MRAMMAAGGTGGHVFPALAVAVELRRRHPSAKVLFVATEKGIESRVIPAAGFHYRIIPTAGFKGKSLRAKWSSLSLLPSGLLANWRLMRKFNPDVVFGTGAYASGPTMLVAALNGRATVLFEPNVEPGLANRLLAPLVSRAAVTYADTERRFGVKATRTGTPVRKEFFCVPPRGKREPRTVLVFGGSQGAAALNHALVEALDALSANGRPLRFVHQTGARDYHTVRAAYDRREMDAEVLPFITDMPNRLAEADLVVCRAGASTVAELAAAGRAAILVPFPHATDQHQLRNAQALERSGAARVVPQADLTGDRLAAELLDLMDHPQRLAAMENAARGLSAPDAAGRIVDLLESVLP